MWGILLPLQVVFIEISLLNRYGILLFILFLCAAHPLLAQSATITGIILDEENRPLSNVTIATDRKGTISDKTGFYLLEVQAETEITLIFSHLGHERVELRGLVLNTNQVFAFNPVMKTSIIQIDSVEVTATGERSVSGITTLSPELAAKIPGANAGIENVLKLLPGVFSNNELSTQYGVRGGNYDENLVYVNEIEVYRPFLIRAGQQEGFSFVNSDLVEKVSFSAGGFQAKYGDKLSSVLDITYKTPTRFALQGEASLLGASISLETISKEKNFSSVSGVRYRNNSLLVNSQQTKTNFNPIFVDLQTYLSYRASPKVQLHFLGNLGINEYRNQPLIQTNQFWHHSQPSGPADLLSGSGKEYLRNSFGCVKSRLHRE